MLYQRPLEGNVSYAAHIIEADSFPLHRHYEVELILCLEGRISAEINGERVFLSRGEMLYTGSFAPHAYEAEKGTRVALVEFGYALLGDAFADFTALSDSFRKYPVYHKVTAEMQKAALILENPQRYNSLDLTGQIYRLCAELLRDSGAEMTVNRGAELERIAPALRLVETNYTDPVTVEDACRETGLSPGNFCTLFKSAVGTGFHTYLNLRRVECACCLLKHTDFTIEEISALSGFSDIKTFYRVFRRETGSSPLNFRKA